MRKQLFLLYIISFSFSLHAQDSDTMRYEKIKEVEVIGYKTKSKIRYDSLGGTSIDLSLLDKMPKIVGSVNPIRFTQLLPSVQTNTELDAGLHIQGCDNSHNNISIDGVHIYNVQHLFSPFSMLLILASYTFQVLLILQRQAIGLVASSIYNVLRPFPIK